MTRKLRKRWYNRYFRWSWDYASPMTLKANWGDDKEWWFRGFFLFGFNFGVLYRGDRHD